MSEALPFFKYHTNPLETGSVKPSEKICAACEQARGFIYTASVYAEQDLEEAICPWCIANGKAAEKFGATFNEGSATADANISSEIITEIENRTLGYESWQSDIWLFHCYDGCEFHGDLSKQEAKNLDDEAIENFCIETELNIEDGREIIENYAPGGNPAIYKFVCRHCGEIKLYTDCT